MTAVHYLVESGQVNDMDSDNEGFIEGVVPFMHSVQAIQVHYEAKSAEEGYYGQLCHPQRKFTLPN